MEKSRPNTTESPNFLDDPNFMTKVEVGVKRLGFMNDSNRIQDKGTFDFVSKHPHCAGWFRVDASKLGGFGCGLRECGLRHSLACTSCLSVLYNKFRQASSFQRC